MNLDGRIADRQCVGFPSRPNVMAVRSQSCECGRDTIIGDRGRRCGNSAKQLAHQAVEFRVGDHVPSLLAPQRSAQHPRQAKHRLATTRQAVWGVVLADQLALNTEDCGFVEREN
jgi:hypothetical protein